MLDLNRKIKIFLTLAVALVFLTPSNYLNALTLGDIEFLISLGVISDSKAEDARLFVTGGKSQESVAVRNQEFGSTQCILLEDNLFIGKSGSSVTALQQFLREQGYFNYPTNSGYFGNVTKSAVIEFQIEAGLIDTRTQIGSGGVGPKTREVIKERSCARNNLVFQEDQTQLQLTAGGSEGSFDNINFIVNSPDSRSIYQELVNETYNGSRLAKHNIPAGQTISADPEARIDIDSRLIEEFPDEAKREFKYEVLYEPDDQVDYFVFTLVCDAYDVLVLDGSLKFCGDSKLVRASRKGTASMRLKFENVSEDDPNNIGIGVEAYNRSENIIGFDEVVDILPTIHQRSINIQDPGQSNRSY